MIKRMLAAASVLGLWSGFGAPVLARHAVKLAILFCTLSFLATGSRQTEPEESSNEGDIRQHIAEQWTMSNNSDAEASGTQVIIPSDGGFRDIHEISPPVSLFILDSAVKMALIGKSSMNSRVILFFWRADLFTHWVNKSNCGAVAKKQNITFIFNDLHTGSSAKFQPQLRGLGSCVACRWNSRNPLRTIHPLPSLLSAVANLEALIALPHPVVLK